jgi:hypothetical protein
MSTPPFQPGQSNEVGGIFYSLVFGDGTVQTTAAVSAAQGGTVPSVLYKSFKTAQTAALSAVPLVPASANKGGMWRINYVATVTVVDTTSFTLGGTGGFQDTFTNGNGDTHSKTSNPTTPAISAANTLTTAVSGVKMAYTGAGTAITYSFGYTAGTGNGAYDMAVFAEYLGA